MKKAGETANKKALSIHKDVLRSAGVKKLLTDFDNKCRDAIESVLVDFHDHSKPIIVTPDMDELLRQAPAVFGDLWTVLCNLLGIRRGVKRGQDGIEEK